MQYLNRNYNDIGKPCRFCNNQKIACSNSITKRDDFWMSLNSQLFDTDIHFQYNIDKDKYYANSTPIDIGENVFIGIGCTVAKGTTLYKNCAKNAGSVVSASFPYNVIIARNPAKIIKNNNP